jgi:hypothetical protein
MLKNCVKKLCIFTAEDSNAEAQLYLALIWDRADVARENIFKWERREAWEVRVFAIYKNL